MHQNNNQDDSNLADESQDNILKFKAFQKPQIIEEIIEVVEIPKQALKSIPKRNVKFMSNIILKQSTPKAKKVLKLEIDVNQPAYDEEGQLLHEDKSDESEEEEMFEGIFNAHLLDEEELDK